MPSDDLDLRALGVELHSLRHARGLSIDKLAGAAGVHRQTVMDIEAARVAPRVDTLHSLAHALGVPLVQLVAPLCEANESEPPGVER